MKKILILILFLMTLSKSFSQQETYKKWNGNWEQNGSSQPFGSGCYQEWRCDCGNNSTTKNCTLEKTRDETTMGSPYKNINGWTKCDAQKPSTPCICELTCHEIIEQPVTKPVSISNGVTIKIVRHIYESRCILGKIYVNDKLVCYSLELPYNGNIKDNSSVPAGTYPAHIRTDPDLGWRIEINMSISPGRDYIQIHKGNSPSNTTGCIIVCSTFDENYCTIPAGSSTIAMTSLKNAFYEARISDGNAITVVIENSSCYSYGTSVGICPKCGCYLMLGDKWSTCPGKKWCFCGYRE
jgi:hypothetical protein